MELTIFLFKAVAISLTGVLAPGPMTAATIAHGTRRRFAGAEIALGHAMVEIPLIGLLLIGLHLVFRMHAFQIAVGLLGGVFLLWLGVGMLRQKPQLPSEVKQINRSSVLTGFVLSAANPYFLLWWATVGLNLALSAKQLGPIAIVLFAIVHWLCDLVWLTIISLAAFYTHRGAGLLGQNLQRGILLVCGIALLFFGGSFIWDALKAFYG
ncbi:MAG: LysE family translocator [Planctomycetaceae bacterium]|nr:LysE family translocator [Planctomycetaceae bacterium]